MKPLNRRGFLKQSLGMTLSVGVGGLSARSVIGANDRLVVGLMGCGGRGSGLLGHFAQRPDITVKTVCEDGHLSAAMGHLANISYRLGKRPLHFDGKSETFTDDPEANALLKRTYRRPWVIPDQV